MAEFRDIKDAGIDCLSGEIDIAAKVVIVSLQQGDSKIVFD